MIGLNAQQNKAVHAPNKPLFVLAGAGTGKTRVLIERIIKFIEQDNINPRQILAITFTNKAKDEIRSRIAKRIGSAQVPSNIYTFHSFFNRILRVHIEKLDRNFKNFKVMDDNDKRAIIRRLLKNLPEGRKIYTENYDSWEPRSAEFAIDWLKTKTKDLENTESIGELCKIVGVTKDDILDFYEIYKRELMNNSLLDYNDLEIYMYKILDFPEIREWCRNFFKAVLIDEFQDTSELQMAIVKRIFNEDSNIFCVGDPDQSIYGFRGAKPAVCDEFLSHFKAECIKLEQNYRSTQNILDVSNALIKNNYTSSSLYKELKSSFTEVGKKVVCAKFKDEWDEVRFVISEIEKIRKDDRHAKLKDFAILYRNNRLSKPFEIVLSEKKLACEVANSVEFFSRKEIQFIVAFLRILFFHDEVGISPYLHTVTSILKIGVGEGAYHAFSNFLVKNKLRFGEGISRIEECPGLKSYSKKGLVKLWEWITTLSDCKDDTFLELTNLIVNITGYATQVREKKEEGRLESIRQFAHSLDESRMNSESSENEEEQETSNNKSIVEEISLRSKDVSTTQAEDYLLLSTIHQVKGLEYKYVFVVKMVDGVFPSRRAKKPEDLEEERRLAYVAFTRAKKALYVTCSASASSWDMSESADSSTFMNEIIHLTEEEFSSQ